MNNVFYGIRRLILMNTTSYSLGDFPLDRPLSISADNNQGKSTAINALQFPFLCNMNDMSFPRSKEDTRRYYFPHENSYVLVEVITESGTFVVGAAGKGEASGFEYQLFAYKANLDINDFTVSVDGDRQEIRNLKELSKHLAVKNVWLKQLAPKQMRDSLMGKTITLKNDEKFSVGIFRLKNMTDSNYRLFIKVFKNLLHMNAVNIEEIKRLLIDILPHTYETSQVDFMANYNVLNEEVEQAKNKADVALNISKNVKDLIKVKSEADENCGILRTLHPQIMSSFESEREKREVAIATLKKNIEAITPDLNRLKTEEEPLMNKSYMLAVDKDKASTRLNALIEADTKYAIFPSLSDVEDKTEIIQKDLNVAISALEQVEPSDKNAIEANLKDAQTLLNSYSARLSAIDNNILFLLNSEFNKEELSLISKIFNNDLLTSISLGGDSANVQDKDELFEIIRTLLSSVSGELYDDGILKVDLSIIQPINLEDYLDYDKTFEKKERLAKQVQKLVYDLGVATGYEKFLAQKSELEEKLSCELVVIKKYKSYLSEKSQEEKIKACFDAAVVALDSCTQQLVKSREEIVELGKKEQKLNNELNKKEIALNQLSSDYAKIKPLLKDDGFGTQPSHRLPNSLEDMVTTYLLTYGLYERARDSVKYEFKMIESMGGLRFTTGSSEESTIAELANAVEGVAELAKVVEDKQRATSQVIGALLKNLRNRYLEFKEELDKFNRKMNRYKISNINSIKFITDSDNEILNLIDNLVDQGTVFSNPDDVHRAVKRLDDMVRKHGVKLTLENLFNLGVSVELENKKTATSFSDSNIESTGTGLTINVILNVMLLKELMHTKKGQITNIPIYIDEAERIDSQNQEALIKQCLSSGFVPVFASVHGQATADCWIGLETVEGRIYVDQSKWFKLKKLDQIKETENA